MKQYPYILQTTPIDAGKKTENGNYIASNASFITVCNCRDEIGRNYSIKAQDGTIYVSTVVLFAPKGTAVITPGTIVRVMDGDNIRLTGRVVASRADYFHTRIWL